MTTDVVVIGVGDLTRGDDGVGCLVVRRLDNLGLPGVTCHCHGRRGVDLVGLWGRHETVFLVDAMRTGGAPGTIQRYDGHTGILPPGFGLDPIHHSQVRRAIELSRALEALPDRLTLYGIEVGHFVVGGLSGAVEAAAERLTQRLEAEIRRVTRSVPAAD